MHKGNPQGVSTAQHNLYLSQFLCVCVWGALIHLGFFFLVCHFSLLNLFIYTQRHTHGHTHTHIGGGGVEVEYHTYMQLHTNNKRKGNNYYKIEMTDYIIN